jgi:2-polyprenyl-3-methyl-5-hydroxy-6-metoxy-1,4-benzoquinol methylase
VRPASRYDTGIDPDSDSTRAKVVRLAGHGKRVLELGCANGYMSRVLAGHDCRVTAIEVDAVAGAEARQFCERVIIGDLNHLDFAVELAGQQFDVILAADVLEHLVEPARVLESLVPFLAPDGYVVASIPNVAHLSVRLALLHGRFPYAELGLLDRTHLRFYTRESVAELFTSAGLVITAFERQYVRLEESEVPYSLDGIPETLVDELARDPDARAYQFIIVAARTGEPAGLQAGEGPVHPVSAFERIVERDNEIRRLQGVLEEAVGVRDTEILRLQGALHEAVEVRDGLIRGLQSTLRAEVASRDGTIRALQDALAGATADLDRLRGGAAGPARRPPATLRLRLSGLLRRAARRNVTSVAPVDDAEAAEGASREGGT